MNEVRQAAQEFKASTGYLFEGVFRILQFPFAAAKLGWVTVGSLLKGGSAVTNGVADFFDPDKA